MAKVKVMIDSVPIEEFTQEELDFYFKNELARGLCNKISAYFTMKVKA